MHGSATPEHRPPAYQLVFTPNGSMFLAPGRDPVASRLERERSHSPAPHGVFRFSPCARTSAALAPVAGKQPDVLDVHDGNDRSRRPPFRGMGAAGACELQRATLAAPPKIALFSCETPDWPGELT